GACPGTLPQRRSGGPGGVHQPLLGGRPRPPPRPFGQPRPRHRPLVQPLRGPRRAGIRPAGADRRPAGRLPLLPRPGLPPTLLGPLPRPGPAPQRLMIRNSANLAAQAPRPAPPAPAASKPPVAEIGAIPVITPDPAPRPPWHRHPRHPHPHPAARRSGLSSHSAG